LQGGYLGGDLGLEPLQHLEHVLDGGLRHG
jgi:hypothetical protein